MRRVHSIAARIGRPKVTLLVIAGLLAAGCVAREPVLYPNETLEINGQEVAMQDIEECEQKAIEHGAADYRGRYVAESTAVGGAAGAVGGLIIGSIFGEAGRGAAVGAAHGASHGFVHGVWHSRYPDPVHRRFMERCLSEKGYDVIGWR